MTKQTLTTIVSAVLFVLLVAGLTVIPVPFVTWGPGSVHDVLGVVDGKPAIQVGGTATYPTEGKLLMTTVSVTRVESRMGLPEAVMAYLLPSRDALPREAVYPPGRSADDVRAAEVAMMDTSKDNAVVAALRSANVPVTELPMVAGVVLTGPSNGQLAPGDLIEKVDSVAVQSIEDVRRAIRKHQVGDTVAFDVLRAGKPLKVTVTSISSSQDRRVPAVGIDLATGYRYAPSISYRIDPGVVGPSAGLMFALAIYDQITPGALTLGKSIAGTGEIQPTGEVARIGGIREKIAAASGAGADAFLVPAGNCADLSGVSTNLDLIKVNTLSDAIGAIATLGTPDGTAKVPRC